MQDLELRYWIMPGLQPGKATRSPASDTCICHPRVYIYHRYTAYLLSLFISFSLFLLQPERQLSWHLQNGGTGSKKILHC
jgi:hypothetical protein